MVCRSGSAHSAVDARVAREVDRHFPYNLWETRQSLAESNNGGLNSAPVFPWDPCMCAHSSSLASRIVSSGRSQCSLLPHTSRPTLPPAPFSPPSSAIQRLLPPPRTPISTPAVPSQSRSMLWAPPPPGAFSHLGALLPAAAPGTSLSIHCFNCCCTCSAGLRR